MFEELEALVAIAETGSMERAANDLSLTPSALTRRIQRLEFELGGVLFDRHFKPPRLTQTGFEILEKSRAILSSLSELRNFTAGITPPVGPFRLGLSHAVAQPDISNVIVELGKQFPLLRPHISNDISSHLLERLRGGKLDGAVVVLPKEMVTSDLDGVTLAEEQMRPVQAKTVRQTKSNKCEEFYRRNWILNPVGCLVREQIRKRVEKLGATLAVAAELHNPGLQLSLIAGNVGVGVLRTSFLRTHPLRNRLRVIEDPNFNIPIKITFYRGRYLGTREQVALELQRMLVNHFENTSAC